MWKEKDANMMERDYRERRQEEKGHMSNPKQEK